MGREGSGLEAALDSTPVSFLHKYLLLLSSLGHQLGQAPDEGGARPAGTGPARARLGLPSKEEFEMIREETFLVNGLVYSHLSRLETGR